MSYFDWDDDDDDDDMPRQAVCPCGCEEFRICLPGDVPATFLIDTDGSVIDTNGHPLCADCGMDYLITLENPETGESYTLSYDDLIGGDDDE